MTSAPVFLPPPGQPGGRRPAFRPAVVALTVAIIVGVALVVAAVFVVARLAVGFGWIDPVSFDKKLATTAATQVVSGKLAPDKYGVVKLSPNLARTALYGEAYVTTDPTGTTWVLFRTWQGRGSDLHGYVYRSTPATGPPPATLDLTGPVIPMNPVGDPPTGRVRYYVDEQIDPNWCEVSLRDG